MDQFGQHIQPLMQCRAAKLQAAAARRGFAERGDFGGKAATFVEGGDLKGANAIASARLQSPRHCRA
jgi:hypothetical protein